MTAASRASARAVLRNAVERSLDYADTFEAIAEAVGVNLAIEPRARVLRLVSTLAAAVNGDFKEPALFLAYQEHSAALAEIRAILADGEDYHEPGPYPPELEVSSTVELARDVMRSLRTQGLELSRPKGGASGN